MTKITDSGSDYLSELNDQQRDAVVYTEGPELVIAGAGSGKTRVLTYKILHLLSHGYEPGRIMALTFTNKAAREMKERVALMAPKEAYRLRMGTFHSVFLRLLRNHCDRIGFKQGFTIYDQGDSRALLKNIIKDFELDEKNYKPSAIGSIISNSKNSLVDARQYVRDAERQRMDARAGRPEIGRIFLAYEERCRLANAMDFDDILLHTNLLLRDNPDILRHYQEYFQYILVDEYQDTNFAQHLIISQLSRHSGRLCMVGDDAQSIYSFRGANISNILGLQNQYPDLRIFKLERNYRSTQTIINAAGSLISKNAHQIPKRVYSEREKGSPVEVVKAYSDLEESFLIANKIAQSKLTAHDSYEDYAVLYRTNAQSRILEESLRKRNIPYRIYGGVSFYQRKEVRDAIGYFRLAVNNADDEALRRVINYPARGIGETTLKKLYASAMERHLSVMETIATLDQVNPGFNKGTLRKLADFHAMISEFTADNQHSNAFELAQLIYNRTGLITVLAHDNTPESISRQENLSELLAGLKEFVEQRKESGEGGIAMTDFLAEVSLATDQDTADAQEGEKVTLMTVHAAKGLEFGNVYIVGVEEDLFPSAMAADSPEQIEEERRLLYVAITRAKRRCTISYASSRYRNGQTQLTSPSRFISDIDTRWLLSTDSAGVRDDDDDAPRFINPLRNYADSRRGSNDRESATTARKGFFHQSSRSDMRRDDSETFRRKIFSADDLEDSLRSNSRRRDSHLRPVNRITPSLIHESPSQEGFASGYSAESLPPGTRIEHQRFGIGTVSEVKGSGADTMIVVDFDNVGQKKLLLRFAKFKITE